MNNDDIIGTLLRAHDFRQINSFIEAVRSDPQAIACFKRLGTTPKVVVTLARERGYNFDLAAFEEWIERAVARLASIRSQDTAGWLARRAESIPGQPEDIARDTHAVIHNLPWSPEFVLDRKTVLSGDVVVVRNCSPIKRLCDHILDHLGTAFDDPNLAQVFEAHDDDTMRHCSADAYQRFLQDKTIPGTMHAIHGALGISSEQTLWEWPGFRLIPPLPRELGIYRDRNTGSVGSHRDTWFGSPHHQINFWCPLWPMTEGAGVVVQPRWFQRAVANTSAGYDQWLNALGLTLPPSPLIDTAGDDELAPHLEPGDLLVFAGQQLHRSGVNHGPATRGSLEWRVLVETDRTSPWRPINVDFRGRGEVAKNWFDHHGRPAALNS